MEMTFDKALTAFDISKKATFRLLNEGRLLEEIASSPNLHKMKYTYLHRQAIFNLAKQLRIDTTPYLTHDGEKYFMYIWFEEDVTRECHRMLNKHHKYEEGPNLDRETLVEMMLDWESARFSKLDKPLNAYQTLMKWMPTVMYEPMMATLQEYNLDNPECGPGITEEEYTLKANAVTPAMIVEEIKQLVNLTFTEEVRK